MFEYQAGGEKQDTKTGEVLFKGRAADKLTGNLPRRKFDTFTKCPYEKLADPERVHIDPFGNVHVCQGLCIGNIWEKPLEQIMFGYNPYMHPVIGPLLQGGPAELARTYGLPAGKSYVSACHLCFLLRRDLLAKFPDYLKPRQVYDR